MSESSKGEQIETEVIFQMEEKPSSSEDPPMSEWSSLEIVLTQANKKKLLEAEGLYSPDSGEICTKYIGMSDSAVFRHPYYNYPAVSDPGIKEAILSPEKPIIYPDDGQELYHAICLEMNIPLVRMFHRNLLTQEIDISYYGVNPPGVRAMAIALQYNKSVRSFNLTENFLNDDACYHLGRMLNSNVTLEGLILSGCRIGGSGILRLGDALSINRSLILLNLSRNYIGEQGGIYFAKQLINGANVLKVNLNNNNLGRQTALAMAEALTYKNKITHLDLSWNNFFHIPTTTKMLEQLANSKVLQELNLAFNSLEGERVAEAIKEIMLIPTLAILDLSNNKFHDEAIQLIMSNIIKAKKLTTLDLSFNPLSPLDAYIVIEKMLKPKVKVENLFLENVWVNQKCLVCLDKIRQMKSRKNFIIKYGGVLHNWTIEGPDPRELILLRADYLGNKDKKRRTDIALFFLRLNKEYSKPIPIKDLIDRADVEAVPLDDDLLSELTYIFPGPKSAKTRSVNLQLLSEYIQRLWPDRQLPPTPPPEPEPEPEPPPKKGKGKGKK